MTFLGLIRELSVQTKLHPEIWREVNSQSLRSAYLEQKPSWKDTQMVISMD